MFRDHLNEQNCRYRWRMGIAWQIAAGGHRFYSASTGA
jgi:hypothetical protein